MSNSENQKRLGRQKSRIQNSVGSDNRTNWIKSVKATLGSLNKKPIIGTVRRVPTSVRNSNNSAYDPSVVSIGPIHHGKTELVAMEEHKWRYLRDLLARTNDAASFIEKCCNSILRLDVGVRSIYAKQLEYEACELAEMMLLDGCFILELVVKDLNAEDDSMIQDKLPLIRRDLMLLENQLPFFIVEKLSSIIFSQSYLHIDHNDIAFHVLCFLRKGHDFQSRTLVDIGFRHILQIVHQSYSLPEKHGNDEKVKKLERCAMLLVGDGVEIEGIEDEDDLLKISVEGSKKKVLKIPQLHINEATESILRNLVAFEQCNIGCGYKFTSYLSFLKGLVCSYSDVELLQQKKVIIDESDGKLDLLKMLHGLVVEVPVQSFCYGYVCSQLQGQGVSCSRSSRSCSHKSRACCNQFAKKNWQILRKDYCPNPWRIIQLVAAFSILVMTGLQAYYSVKN